MPNTLKRKINQNKLSLVLNKIPGWEDETVKKEAFVSMLATEVFQEYLEEERGINISGQNDFYCYSILLENNIIIDIRPIVGEAYPQMCIPVEHFQNELNPDIYIGLRIDKNFEEAEIIGFIKREEVSEKKGNSQYIIVYPEELNDIEEINQAINLIKKKEKTYYALDHEKAIDLFLPFIDNNISKTDKNYLLEHISGCAECRKLFNNIAKLDFELKKEKEKILLDTDYTLRLLANDPVMASNEEVEIFVEDETLSEEVEESSQVLEEIVEIIGEEETLSEEVEESLQVLEEVVEIIGEEETLPEEVEASSQVLEEIVEITEEKEALPEEVEESLIEEVSVEKTVIDAPNKPTKNHSPRDWADELAANLPEEENDKGEEKEDLIVSLDEDKVNLLDEDILTPLDKEENLHDVDLDLKGPQVKEPVIAQEELVEKAIIEEPKISIAKEEDEEEIEKDFIELEKIPSSAEEPEKNEKPSEVSSAQEEMENILESLNDVEVIQGEEDIDNLLSFFDHIHEDENKLESSKPVKKQLPSEKPKEKDRGDVKFRKGDEMGYTSILEAQSDDENEDVNFILEENLSSVEVIRQEDLMHIFDTDTHDYKAEKGLNKKDIKTILKTWATDRNVIIYSSGMAATVLVLFLFLGQINKQIEIANTPTTIIHKNPETPTVPTTPTTTPDGNEIKKSVVKRTREPLKTYSREIITIVKPEKQEEEQNVTPNIEENLPKIPEATENEIINEIPEVNIKNISWELPADIAREPEIKSYFLSLGKEIKATLSKELAIPEIDVQNSRINIYTELSSKGDILKTEIVEGSGEEQIDTICVNILTKTINSAKLAKISLKQEKIKFLMIIRI